jgi:transposase-like protein
MAGQIPSPHSPETRQRALELFAEGFQPREVAEELGVNESTVRNWSAREGRRQARELARAVGDMGRVPKVADCDGSWPAQRELLQREVVPQVLDEAVAAMRLAMTSGQAAQARSLATVCGIAIDKLAVLGTKSGRQGKSGDVGSLRAEVRKLQKELGEGDDGDGDEG